MSKPIDNWRKGDPRQSMKEWQRPMIEATIKARFLYEHVERFLAIKANPVTKIGNTTVHHGEIPDSACPECNGSLTVHSFTLASGDVVYWPHCEAHPRNENHGFGKYSRHGNRSPSGRKAGSRNSEPEPNDPTPEPEPAKPEPVSEPKIPAGKVSHERLKDVIRLYDAGVRAFLLEGPAGSGKTSLAADLAEIKGMNYVSINGNKRTEQEDLSKFRHPVTGVERLSYFLKALVDAPCVGNIDEGDGVPPDALLSLNEPSANRRITINGEVIKLHPDSVIIVTANATNGTSRVYTGRYPMDGATKSRFLPVFCDYSPTIEAAVCPDRSLRDAVREVRDRVNNDPQMARQHAAMVGTRLLIQAGLVGKAFGLVGRDALRKTFEIGHPEEIVKQLLG